MIKTGIYQGPSIQCDFCHAFESVTAALQLAQQDEVDIILFPELYLCGYDISAEQMRQYSITQDSPEMNTLCELAREYRIALGMGYAERESDNLYNSCCLIDFDGAIRLNYRKTHLWDPTNEGEKVVFTPGSELPVADVYFPRCSVTVKFGILICFDCEFPEPARLLALKGASMLLIPTAICDDATPRIMIPCRAAENHMSVLYSNLSGLHSKFPKSLNGEDGLISASDGVGTCFCGQSAIIAPNGDEIIRLSHDASGLFSACIDTTKNTYVNQKKRNDYLIERRPSLYCDLIN